MKNGILTHTSLLILELHDYLSLQILDLFIDFLQIMFLFLERYVSSLSVSVGFSHPNIVNVLLYLLLFPLGLVFVDRLLMWMLLMKVLLERTMRMLLERTVRMLLERIIRMLLVWIQSLIEQISVHQCFLGVIRLLFSAHRVPKELQPFLLKLTKLFIHALKLLFKLLNDPLFLLNSLLKLCPFRFILLLLLLNSDLQTLGPVLYLLENLVVFLTQLCFLLFEGVLFLNL